MDRQIVYPGSIPLDTDVLSVQRNTLVALGYLAQATLGTAIVADGLACLPTQPGSLSVVIGPGSITQFGEVDATAFGSLAAVTAPLVRMGISLAAKTFALQAPTVAGQAINYLVEASLLEADATPVVLPYYNAANPGQPFSGPGGDGLAQNTQRLQSVQVQVKAGAPGAIGSQPTPPVDAGWVGLYIVTVSYGQTVIGSSSIVAEAAAPFVNFKLPQLTPGTHNLAAFTPTTQGTWVVPPGITTVKLRIWGGGGAGGAGFSGAGGGGAGGGYSEGYYAVAPGQSIAVTVGAGGSGSGTGGGASSFGSLASASGGTAGQNGSSGTPGTGAGSVLPGLGYGTGVLLPGGSGGDAAALVSGWIAGPGGHAHGSGGTVAVVGTDASAPPGKAGATPGAGGGGGIGASAGGQGGAGLVLVEW